MNRLNRVSRLTDKPYLNFYELQVTHRSGVQSPYYMASRVSDPAGIKAATGINTPNGVIMYGVWGPDPDRIVLVRQYRYPIGGYVYEFPAGLIEPGENVTEAAVREMYEETGLEFRPVECGSCSRPFFTSVGMTDESCATVFGRCYGSPTSIHQEGSEDIQVVLADREECRRILREENVAIMCAYMLMHFIAGPGDPLGFLEAQRE